MMKCNIKKTTHIVAFATLIGMLLGCSHKKVEIGEVYSDVDLINRLFSIFRLICIKNKSKECSAWNTHFYQSHAFHNEPAIPSIYSFFLAGLLSHNL